MIISLIAAVAKNNALGKDNKMLWHLSTDLKRFKRLTAGHCVLMGRKTFEALGKPLPKRTNIIITRNAEFHPEGTVVFPSIDEGVAYAEKQGEEELFIIGGGEIYTQCIRMADRMYLTKVWASPEADAFYPEFEESEWKVAFEESHLADEQNDHPFVFLDLERR